MYSPLPSSQLLIFIRRKSINLKTATINLVDFELHIYIYIQCCVVAFFFSIEIFFEIHLAVCVFKCAHSFIIFHQYFFFLYTHSANAIYTPWSRLAVGGFRFGLRTVLRFSFLDVIKFPLDFWSSCINDEACA